MQKTQPNPIVENELFDSESLMWWGKPKPMSMIRSTDMGSVIGGLVAAGFAAFFIMFSSSLISGSGFSMPGGSFGGPDFDLFRIFFFGIPLFMMAGGLWEASKPLRRVYEGRNTTYALTDQRAIIITRSATGSTNVRSFYPRDIERVQRSSRADGTGDVIFATDEVTRYRSSSSGSRRTPYTVTIKQGFFGIQDARYVEDVMIQLFIDTGKEKRKPTEVDVDPRWE